MWQGQLLHIHTARAAREAMQSRLSATLLPGVGIAGDRYATALGTYSALPDIREVTLIEDETLIALLRDHAIELAPNEHRRNLTTRDVPLNHLVGRRFRVGTALLEPNARAFLQLRALPTSVIAGFKGRSSAPTHFERLCRISPRATSRR